MNKEGNDVVVEDEESMSDLTVEVLKQVVIDPTCNSMLDSDSEDSLLNPPSLSPSPPPPETSRHTPSPISILTLPPVQMLREAKMYFKHSIYKSTNDRLTNQDSVADPIIRVEDSDAAFINKAMAPKVSDRRRSSIENELESSMVLKTVVVLHDGMSNRLSNSQILTSKDSGFTEFSGSKGVYLFICITLVKGLIIQYNLVSTDTVNTNTISVPFKYFSIQMILVNTNSG